MSDKNIPLSELIRIGSKLTGQSCGKLYDRYANATCAIGAAYLAKHGEFAPDGLDSCVALRSCGVDPWQRIDLLERGMASLASEICLANDSLEWTREQIADALQEQGL